MSAPRLKVPVQAIIEALANSGWNRVQAAEKLGVHRATLRLLMKEHGIKQPNRHFEIETPPKELLPVEDLVKRRKQQYKQKASYEKARNLIPCTVKIDGPIGLHTFGDPHLDDDGTDLDAVERHTKIVNSSDAIFAINSGDSTNNWVGRLGHLYSEQSTSAPEAWQLVEWFINSLKGKWLFMIGGNHDCLDMETEALTRRGWLKHKDIRDDDEVFSLDRDTNKGVWTPILRKFSRPNSETMVRVNARGIDMLVTPNHRVLSEKRPQDKKYRVDYGYSKASELPCRFKVPAAAVAAGDGVDLSDDQIRLAGWILTDGSIGYQGNSPRVSIWQSKQHSMIESVLVGCGLEYGETIRQRNITQVCGKALVSEALPQREYRLNAENSRKALEIIHTKECLPGWVADLDTRQFTVFLDALVSGDGSWASDGNRAAGVMYGARGFLDQLQALFVSFGLRCSITSAKGRDNDHRLNFCRRDCIEVVRKHAVSAAAAVGAVWCLTVPHGNFMVRRNGAAYFTGNCWSGSGDPLKWMAKQASAMYESSEVRMNLKFPNKKQVRINARHDFAGKSQYNPAHGALKSTLFGTRDHISVCGHKHVSGYSILKMDDLVCHAVQVASYKIYDRFARDKGFRDLHLSPCAFLTIDPSKPDDNPDMIKVFWNPEEGSDYLRFLRRKK